MICDHWTVYRSRGRRPAGVPHRCRFPARFRVRANARPGETPQISASGERPCGIHVRPYLMDNGDSVWQPWIIERIET